jgi:2-oxoglutarate dehydrogenase complex dehydrogenase (E1) component-like enzyme
MKEDDKVQRVIFASGKHYYNLVKQRTALGARDVALVRLEGLSPFPTFNLQQEVAKYRNAKSKEQYHNFLFYINMTT